jgi:hypothetical protein
MPTKEEILKKHYWSPREWSFVASIYFGIPKILKDKFNMATIDLAENASDLSKDEALFISSFDLDLAREGYKPILTEKARKQLRKVT